MKVYCLSDNEMDENTYIVKRADDITIIDPGFNYSLIDKYLKENELKPTRILLTHGHIDHFCDTDKIYKNFGDIPLYISKFDYNFLFDESINCAKDLGLKGILKEKKNVIKVDDKDNIDGFIFHLTPGHTPGSACIEIENLLFTGDTLFRGTIGRSDLPLGSMSQLNESIKYIATSFSKNTIILPGHYSKSTLIDELKNNPYLKDIKKEKK